MREIESFMQSIVDLPIEQLNQGHMARVAHMLNAEHSAFIVLKYPHEEPSLATYAIATYSDAWFVRYVVQEYSRIDPVIAQGRKSEHPFDWRTLSEGGDLGRFWQDAKDHGVSRVGLSIPVHSQHNAASIFSISNLLPEAVDEILGDDEFVSLLYKFTSFLHDKALRKHQNKGSLPVGEDLTQREKDVLKYASEGMQMRGIAEAMERSPETIKTHLTTARQKLGALTTTHAVALATRDGILAV